MKQMATVNRCPKVLLYAVGLVFVVRGSALNVDPGVEADLAKMLATTPGVFCKLAALKTCVTFRRLYATEVKALRLSNASEFIKPPAGDVVEGCERTWSAQCTAGTCEPLSEEEQYTRATTCRRLLEMKWQGPDLWPRRTEAARPPPKPKKAAPCKKVEPEPVEKAGKKRRRRRRRRKGPKRKSSDASKFADLPDDGYEYPDDEEAAVGDHSKDDTHMTAAVSEGKQEHLAAAVHDLKKMVVDAYKQGMRAGSRTPHYADEHLAKDTPPPAQQKSVPAQQPVQSVPAQQPAAQPPQSPGQPQIIYVAPPVPPPAAASSEGSSAAASAAAAAATAAAAIAASVSKTMQSHTTSVLDRHPLQPPPMPTVEQTQETTVTVGGGSQGGGGAVGPMPEPPPPLLGKKWVLDPIEPPPPLDVDIGVKSSTQNHLKRKERKYKRRFKKVLKPPSSKPPVVTVPPPPPGPPPADLAPPPPVAVAPPPPSSPKEVPAPVGASQPPKVPLGPPLPPPIAPKPAKGVPPPPAAGPGKEVLAVPGGDVVSLEPQGPPEVVKGAPMPPLPPTPPKQAAPVKPQPPPVAPSVPQPPQAAPPVAPSVPKLPQAPPVGAVKSTTTTTMTIHPAAKRVLKNIDSDKPCCDKKDPLADVLGPDKKSNKKSSPPGGPVVQGAVPPAFPSPASLHAEAQEKQVKFLAIDKNPDLVL